MKEERFKKPDIVRKSNLLIASKLNLTRNESRLLEMVFSQINSFEDVQFENEYRVEVSSYVNVVKNPNIYSELENVANGLTSKNIHLRQEDGSFEFLTITNKVKYDADEGALYVQLNDNLLGYLLKSPKAISHKKKAEIERKDRIDELKKEKESWAYTSYQLKYHLILSSNHALRIYELLKQYEKIGSRTLTVEELKIVLEIEDKYPLYADFKRNVIKRAQKELKKKTDIVFDFEEIKKKRKVHAVKFYMHPNPSVVSPDAKKVTSELPSKNAGNTILRLKALKKDSDEMMADETALYLVNRFGEDYINQCIDVLEKEDMSKKTNFVGYVIKAIEENWLENKISDVKAEVAKKEEVKRKKETKKQEESEREKIDKMYSRYYNTQIELLLSQVDLDDEIDFFLAKNSDDPKFKTLAKDLNERNELSRAWALFITDLISANPQVRIMTRDQFEKKFKQSRAVKNQAVKKQSIQEERAKVFSEQKKENTHRIPLGTLKEMADATGRGVEELAENLGYTIDGDSAYRRI